MKKILLSLGVIAIVAVGAIGVTRSFFSDTETSTGNTFTAGAIDLKIDSTTTYNGEAVPASTWALKDLVPTADKFFNFDDIKPGDEGENTISLHVLNNDAYVCAAVSNLTSDDNGLTEPESEVDTTDGAGNGELDDEMVWTIWRDDGTGGGIAGNNIQDGTEPTLTSGNPVNGVLTINDSTTGPLLATETAYLGVAWSLPASSGNETQTDSMTGDISFQVVQSRNNDNFVCGQIEIPEEPERTVLLLENKNIDAGWDVIQDETSGTLSFISSHPTFDYTLNVQNLVPNTSYSMIYYADPWPGNNPGKLLATLTTDGSGNASISGDVELGMDLPSSPDTNYPTGAKIWVIKSAEYTPNSVNTWPVGAESLFENNLVIYEDTNN